MEALKRAVKKIICLCFKRLVHKAIRRKKLSLDCSLWDLHVNEKGHLVFGGCDCVELAGKYGTPIHVVNKELLKKNYDEFYEGFKSHNVNFEIYYSYKTNPIPGILKVLHDKGAGAEVISPYELWLALKLGVSPDLIIYDGPNKSDESLKIAVEERIKLININSFNEIERIGKIAKSLGIQAKVGVRLCTDIGWGSQFGLKVKSGEAFKAFEKIKKIRCMDIEGIHIHLGTGIKGTSMYEKAIETIFELVNEAKHKLGICIKYVDLGGGFGVPTVKYNDGIETKLCHVFDIPYMPPKVGDTSCISVFANRIASTIKKECEKYKLKSPVLLFEPGRVITSSAQMLLTKVGDLKEGDNVFSIAIVDAGINVASPVTWEYHEIFVASKMNSNCKEFYSIAGPLCTPADLLCASKKLPLLEIGDIILILDTGAYFTSFSNNFSFPRPAIIMVSDGKPHIVRNPESYENMTSLDNFCSE